MNLKVLHREQRLDCLDYVQAAITDVRACIEVELSCGPMLVACYRALSALGELREVVDAMPVVDREERRT